MGITKLMLLCLIDTIMGTGKQIPCQSGCISDRDVPTDDVVGRGLRATSIILFQSKYEKKGQFLED